ncbi:MAG: hypothetical protein ABR555_18350, partial [Pyrinomonadaceae bacterium]
VTVYNDANLGPVAKQELTIKLPEKFFVTDIRTGKQFGYTDLIYSSLNIGDALVLGLSPVENRITIAGPASAQRGDHVSFSVASTSNGDSLIRCHVFAPDGAALPIYFSNVFAAAGKGRFVLPFAINDASGRYRVRATDVVTGATTDKIIELK